MIAQHKEDNAVLVGEVKRLQADLNAANKQLHFIEESGAAATASFHAVAGTTSSASRSSCCACGLLPTPAVAGVRLSVS